jgi:hypothetical protein
MNSAAMMAAAGRQSVEDRKAAKQQKMLKQYFEKHPDPRIRELGMMGLIDPADILKEQLSFDRFKQEKDYEVGLKQKQAQQTLAALGMGGGAPAQASTGPSGGAGPAPMPAPGGGAPAPAQGGTGYQPQTAEEYQIAVGMAADGKGPGEIMQAIADNRMKREQENRMQQGEQRQQSAEIDRRGSEISKDFTKRVEPLAVVQNAADAAERIKIDPETGLPDATGAQTIETLYGFVKALDPDSVVREAEVSLAGEAAALMDRFKFWQAKIIDGQAGALPPEALADIKNAIGMMANAARAKEMRARTDAFRQGGGRGVGNMDAYMPSIGGKVAPGNTAAINTPYEELDQRGLGGSRYEADAPIKARRPAQAEPGLAVGTVEDGYRYKGGDPTLPSSWEEVQ